MNYYKVVYLVLTLTFVACNSDFCTPDDLPNEKRNRYLLYSVNYGEGFNLRRDVHVRMANLIKKLNEDNEGDHWILVLPPWYYMYHWFNSRHKEAPPWSDFFDLASMNKYIPVMELKDYLISVGQHVGATLVLQHYADTFTSGQWKEKYEEENCQQEPLFSARGNKWQTVLAGQLLYSEKAACVSVAGTTNTVTSLFTKSQYDSVAVHHAEVLLHHHYADRLYWQARRSMRYSPTLEQAARHFRREELLCSEQEDVVLESDWRHDRPTDTPAVGCPYLAVHFRRRDFLKAHPEVVPSIANAAHQIDALLSKLKLHTVFIATDAPNEEVSELAGLLRPANVKLFSSAQEFSDGQLAVIDQIIAAHARYFIGTHESTFSFRIQEDREILGLASSSTFNRLCGDVQGNNCEQPTQWKIVY